MKGRVILKGIKEKVNDRKSELSKQFPVLLLDLRENRVFYKEFSD